MEKPMKAACCVLIFFIVVCHAAVMSPTMTSANASDLPATDIERVQEGSPAPDFTLGTVDLNSITLSDYQGGKNVVLVFYRGWW